MMSKSGKKTRRKKAKSGSAANPSVQNLSIDQALELAVGHHGAGNLQQAEGLYRQILQAAPEEPVALHLLGVIAHQTGNHNDAVDLINRAVAVKPDYADAHGNLGLALQGLGRLDDAVASFNKAIAINPDFTEAHYNLGNALQERGRTDDAIASYGKAIAIRGDHAGAHYNLGNALRESARFDDAVASYNRAIAIQPDHAQAYGNMGLAMKERGRLDDAVTSFQKALEIDSGIAEVHNNLGNALEQLGRIDDAFTCFRKALDIQPDFADSYNNLGFTFRGLGQLDDAAANFQSAIDINPDYADAHNNLGAVLLSLGLLDDAVDSCQKALAINPDKADAHSNLLYSENYRPGITVEKLYQLHVQWDERHAKPLAAAYLDYNNLRDPGKRLRIGLVSADLGRHPVGYFLVGLLENVSKGEVEFICYADGKPDDMSDRLRHASDGWLDCRGMTDEMLGERIHLDRVDILFDLAGHTAKNRLLMFARKPSPIQVTWVGYVGTTGLAAMDYLLSDAHYTPKSEHRHYREKIINMPDAYISYDPPSYAPDVGPLPYAETGTITFGSFNNTSKMNAEVMAVWVDVLESVPDSRLLLKYRGMNTDRNTDRFTSFLTARGLDASRLILEGASPHEDLLGRYNNIDIALDTFPYSGGLTTCEALWMGVPVITVPGDTFASRHSLSHLSTVGLSELVATDAANYVELATQLANDIPRLTELRSGLRDRMAQSPLCDAPRFARNFTSAMREVWRQWCIR